MVKRVLSVRCPTCRKIVLKEEENFPFCSDRCRLIDLGKWASGRYVVSQPLGEDEESLASEQDREPQPDKDGSA